MFRQIKLLSGIQFCNAFGFNEAKYGKDKKKKNRLKLIACTMVFVGLMVMLYVSVMSIAYVSSGMGNIIPSYMFAITSLIIFFFSLFKAGNVIFNIQSYEREVVYPIKSGTIIISKFFTMYVSDFLLSLLVIVPSAVIYAVTVKPGAMFYVSTVIGAVILPLIPLTAATALGAVILAVSSRMRHKNIVSIILSLILTIGIIIFSSSSSFTNSLSSNVQFSEISAMIIDKMGQMYPPVKLFEKCAVESSVISLVLLVVISVVMFSLLVLVVGRYYQKICTALNSTSAKRNYVITNQTGNSQLKALYTKEIKRYFASSIYVLNTVIGYILMVVMSIATLVMGTEKISEFFGGAISVEKFIPIILATMCVISPSTTSAISIEGKQWWIANSLPIKAKTLFNSKILVSLTIALPCYVVSEIIMFIALKPDLRNAVLLVAVPLVYILFSTVAGLFINIKMPMFNWENETVVVKQSGAVFVSMIAGFVSIVIPFIITAAIKSSLSFILMLAVCAVVLAATAVIYNLSNKTVLNKI